MKPSPSPLTSTTLENLQTWRERILAPMLIGISGLGFVAYVTAILSGLKPLQLIALTITYFWLVAVTLLGHRLSFKLRAGGLLLFLFLIGLVGIRDSGLSGTGRDFLLAFVVLTSTLLGLRAGIAALTISLGALATIGWLMSTGSLELPPPSTMANSGVASSWISSSTTFLMLAVMAAGSAAALVRGLQRSLQKERQLVTELETERNLLEQRVHDRTHELEDSKIQLEHAYSALQKNQEKLLISEKMASLGRLSAGIAHEINTPLAAVRTALVILDKLANEYLDSTSDLRISADDHREIAVEMKNSIQLAESAAERAVAFVQGIKGQTRDLTPREGYRFDAVATIQDTLLLLSHTLHQSGCTVTFEHSADYVELDGVPSRLAQVITNLMTNAIEATPPDGAPITIRLTQTGQAVELRVTDRGCSIAPEHLPKVFDPMFTTKPFGTSTGLGLTIVHDIVTGEFAGGIEVASQPGQGTTFTVRFPAAGPNLAVTTDASDRY